MPFLREVFFREDRLNRAFVDTEAAVDARIGIDEELVGILVLAAILRGMDAIHRADFDASGVFGTDTRLSDDVGHRSYSSWTS